MPKIKPPLPGMGYILFIHWPKGSHEIISLPTPQVITKYIGCFMQPDIKVLLLKTTLTSVIYMENSRWCPTTKGGEDGNVEEYVFM